MCSQREKPSQQSGLNAPAILVLDDQAGVRRLVSEIVTRFLKDALVIEASCNVEALEYLASRRVTGIIQDFQRAGETGLDLVTAMQADDITSPPVVIYSGTGIGEILKVCRSCGFEPVELFESIVPKIDTASLAETVLAVFGDDGGRGIESHETSENAADKYPFRSSYNFLKLAWLLQKYREQIQFPLHHHNPEWCLTMFIGTAPKLVHLQLQHCIEEMGKVPITEAGAIHVVECISSEERDLFLEQFRTRFNKAKRELQGLCGLSPYEFIVFRNGARIAEVGGLKENWRVEIEYGFSETFWELGISDDFLIEETGSFDRPKIATGRIWENIDYSRKNVRVRFRFENQSERGDWVRAFERRANCLQGKKTWLPQNRKEFQTTGPTREDTSEATGPGIVSSGRT